LIFELSTLLIKEKNKKYIAAVTSTSQRFKDIVELNKKYMFYNVSDCYYKTISLNSKSQYDKFDFDGYFRKIAVSDKESILRMESMILENQLRKKTYKEELKTISPYATEEDVEKLNLKWDRYHNIEINLTKELILTPTVFMSIHCTKSYTSPQGRNHYSEQKVYSLNDFHNALEDAKKIERLKENKEYQRRIMTDSLRYDVMKRDNFRCVLCGRSAKDGVTLHVDHIRPVSKGGKTVMSNLRTLCADCNFGKSDKFDEYGNN
jgi:hypothetical protein